MSSKIITTVVAAVIVAPFAAFTTHDAVSIWQDLHHQQAQIQQLHTDSVKLDKKLEQVSAQKQQSLSEVKQLEQQTADSISKRQQLEKELGAN